MNTAETMNSTFEDDIVLPETDMLEELSMFGETLSADESHLISDESVLDDTPDHTAEWMEEASMQFVA